MTKEGDSKDNVSKASGNSISTKRGVSSTGALSMMPESSSKPSVTKKSENKPVVKCGVNKSGIRRNSTGKNNKASSSSYHHSSTDSSYYMGGSYYYETDDESTYFDSGLSTGSYSTTASGVSKWCPVMKKP